MAVGARSSRAMLAWAVGVAVLSVVVVGFVVWQGRSTGLLDLRIYLGADRGWRGGGSLYGFADPTFHKSATYPPAGLLVLAPMTLVPVRAAEVLWTVANLGALGIMAWVVTGPSYLRLVGHHRRTVALAGVAVAIPTAAVWTDLNQGQVNLWLWLAILVDVAAVRRGRPWAGALVGLATAAKLVPGLFIVFFVAIRRRGAAGRAVAAALVATVVAAALAPADARTFFTSLLWDTSRVGGVDESENNSLRALVSHTPLGPSAQVAVWVGLAAAVGVVGIRGAVKAWRVGRDLEAVVLVGCTAALLSPISWTHHLVFGVLVLALVVPSLRPDAGPAGARRPMAVALLVVGWLFLVDPVGRGANWVTSDLRALAMVAVVAVGVGRGSSGDQARGPLTSRATLRSSGAP